MATAADVPLKYDVVLDGEGYCFYRPWTGGDSANAPQLGIHSFSPAFVPRTNTSPAYGDDQQEFYLTFSQKDWSLGEQKKYQSRQDIVQRYWIGTNVDVRVPGQVSLRRISLAIDTGTGSINSLAPRASSVMAANATNLYTIAGDGSVTDHGAHGVGGSPANEEMIHAIATDSTDTYLSAGTNGTVRKWNGSTFSEYSSESAHALAYLNNALYGLNGADLVRWSGAAPATGVSLFSWKDVDGTDAAIGGEDGWLIPYGSKLLIHFAFTNGFPGSTWIYDGVGVSKIFDHPSNFVSRSGCVLNGVFYFGGYFSRLTGASTQVRMGIMYYANGSTGLLWEADDYITLASDLGGSCVAPFGDGILFTDDSTEKFMWYNSTTGGIHSVSSYTTTGTGINETLVACNNFAVFAFADDIIHQYPDDTTFSTSGTVTSSLIDFDNVRPKVFSDIHVDYDEGSDGDGGSIDIAYRMNDVSGAYTSLQTGAVSGTSYPLGVVGDSISVRITLNKGTSTLGPILKRMRVRATPFGSSKHRALLHLDCTDNALDNTGGNFIKSGHARAVDLRTAAMAETVSSFTDVFDTMDAVIDTCELTQVRSGKKDYVASVVVREV